MIMTISRAWLALLLTPAALLAQPPFRGAKPIISRLTGDELRLTYLETDDGSPND